MVAFLASLSFVILAEMGDKTQLLVMAFASKYKWHIVLWGVFTATVFNHFLAVVVGNYLDKLIPLNYIKIAASVSFILFGLWELHRDRLHGEDKKFNFSPFWTVAVAFFLSEMGDKTQLATIALAARYNAIIPVWIGTTTGMMIADAAGIIVGIVLHKKIPDNLQKWVAAFCFIGFGLYGLYDALL